MTKRKPGRRSVFIPAPVKPWLPYIGAVPERRMDIWPLISCPEIGANKRHDVTPDQESPILIAILLLLVIDAELNAALVLHQLSPAAIYSSLSINGTDRPAHWPHEEERNGASLPAKKNAVSTCSSALPTRIMLPLRRWAFPVGLVFFLSLGLFFSCGVSFPRADKGQQQESSLSRARCHVWTYAYSALMRRFLHCAV